MRPKVFAPPSVNKVSYGLMSHDIDGATSQYKCVPYRPRDTDPNTPRYILPGSSAIPLQAVAAVAAAGAAAVPADASPDAPSLTPRQQHSQPPQPTQQQQQRMPTRDTRDTLNVSDINVVSSVSERPARLETRHTQLDTRDVEGSWPGWEPHFRAHVGKNLRDPGLDVSDISGTFRRRRVLSARPNLGSSRGGGGGDGGSAVGAARPPAPPSPPPPAEATQPREEPPAAAAADGWKLRQAQSYLPPPLTWQPPPAPTDCGQQPPPPQRSGGDASSSGSGSGAASRRHSHPVRQQLQPSDPQLEQQPSVVQHAAGEWPTTVTLPLRPSLQPPPFATHIPTGSVASVLSASLDAAAVSRVAPAADHPATTVGKPTPCKRDPKARHSAKLTLSEVQRAEAADAQRVIASLRPSREAVEEFYSSCRRLDRETCGKVTPTDFMHALERANIMGSAPAAVVEPTAAGAAAVTLARGLQDGSGMVSYRYLARALLENTTLTRRPSLTATVPVAPQAPAALQPETAAPQPETVATPASTTAVVAEAKLPAAPFASLPSTFARQTSERGAGSRTGPVVTVEGVSAGADGGSGPAGPTGDASAAPTVVTAAAAAAPPRRSVNWAPEPSSADGAADGSQAASDAPATAAPPLPPTPYHSQDLQRLERQERQLRREGSQRRRPYSAAPSGSKGAGAVAAVFKLLGAPQPILYNTPTPAQAQTPSSASTSGRDFAGISTVASAAAPPAGLPTRRAMELSAKPPPAPPATADAAADPYDGIGFGPHWPPEPLPSTLQKRPSAAIMEGTSVQLRDVCDTTYFPYKSQSLWFTGRAPPTAGPDGGEAPGGPAEAAREYQPSVDITSFIVGKGHHRIHVPPSGHKLEPEVEAAIVAKLRPRSAKGGDSPESTARIRTASSVVTQLHVDNPLLYPGNVDPTTPAGAALKGLLGCLYSTGGAVTSTSTGSAVRSSTVVAPAGAARPATAGPRRSSHLRSGSVSRSMSSATASGGGTGGAGGAAAGGGGSASGAVRVGRAALERQMHREEVAAVRRLC